MVERYSTLFDEATDMPFGLGCGGILDVLLEPVDTPECHALMSAIELTLQGQEHSVATWLPTDVSPLRRAVFRAEGKVVFSSDGLSSQSLGHAKLASMRKDDVEPDGLLLERLTSPQRIFLFGAEDDVRPLAAMGKLLGWRVTIADGRSHLMRRDRSRIRTSRWPMRPVGHPPDRAPGCRCHYDAQL